MARTLAAVTTFDPDLLLANAAWVRALARELAGPGEADDLVQETWLVALQRPTNARTPGAWLAGVVRHLARRSRRGAGHRAAREAACAREERAPAAAELVAEADLQRRVLAAVMRLDEPGRSAVLLRYFRGASVEEIARVQGVPWATARTRLQRALARLRGDLERAFGGREAWGAAALALARADGPPSAIGPELAGVSAGTAAWLGFALVAGIVAALAWRTQDGMGTGLSVGPASEQKAVAGPAAAPAPDTPRGGVLRSTPEEPRESFALQVSSSGEEQGEEGEAEPDASAAGEEPPRLLVHVLGETGAPLTPAEAKLQILVTPAAPEDGAFGLRDSTRFSVATFAALGLPTGGYALLNLQRPPPFHVSAVLGDTVVATEAVLGPADEVTLRIERGRLEALRGSLRVRFVDSESGRPLAGGSARLGTLGTLPSGTPLDASGTILFEQQAPGLYWLAFQDDEHARLERAVRVSAGELTELDVHVWPRATVRGTAVDSRGVPLDAVELSWTVLEDGLGAFDWENGADHRHPSSFELEGVPRTRLLLSARARRQTLTDRTHAPALRIIDASSGVVDGVVIQLEEGMPVSMRCPEAWFGRQLILTDEDGLPLRVATLGKDELSLRLARGRHRLALGRGERVELRGELEVGDGPLALDLSELMR